MFPPTCMYICIYIYIYIYTFLSIYPRSRGVGPGGPDSEVGEGKGAPSAGRAEIDGGCRASTRYGDRLSNRREIHWSMLDGSVRAATKEREEGHLDADSGVRSRIRKAGCQKRAWKRVAQLRAS